RVSRRLWRRAEAAAVRAEVLSQLAVGASAIPRRFSGGQGSCAGVSASSAPGAFDEDPLVAALLPATVVPGQLRALPLPVAGDPFVLVAAPLLVAAGPDEPIARIDALLAGRWRR